MPNNGFLSEYEQVIYELSELIVAAQKPIRILDAIKWDPSVEDYFLAIRPKNCR